MSKNPPAALVKAKPVTTKALAKVAAPESPGIIVKLIELASNPAVDIAKINALIDTNERIMAITAKQAFDRDFAAMQSELPIVTKAGLAKVAHRDGQGSHEIQYARFSDIRRAVDPVLSRHGFALRFRNRMADGLLTITGILSHQQGHREEDEFTTGPENSGSKNTLQAWGSARQYGMRYTANALLGLASEADDDDGEEAAPRPKASPPPRQSAPQPGPTQSTPSASDALVISDKQRKRLWVIIKKAGRSEESVKDWLLKVYKIDSTSKIRRIDYEMICNTVEAPGPLPFPSVTAREPGEDG